MSDRDALDCLGRFLMQQLRDAAFDKADRLLDGHWRAPSLQALQKGLEEFSVEQRELVRRSCRRVIDGAIHDLLFALAEEAGRANGRVAITVDGRNAAAVSDGLQGEPYGKRGWQARYSRFGEGPQSA